MDDKLLDVLIEGLFGYRRGLLKQVGALDKAIEQLTTLKEGKPHMDMGPNPDECDHKFEKGSCEKCGIFEEIAKKKDEDIE